MAKEELEEVKEEVKEEIIKDDLSEEPAPEGIDNPDENLTDLDAPVPKEKAVSKKDAEPEKKDEKSEKPAKEGEKAGEKKPVVPKEDKDKQVYTQEELELLLKADATTIDTSRLTNEGKLLMKSFQRGLDGKFKEAAEEKKRVQAEAEAQQSPKLKLFKRYLADTIGVTKEINEEIQILEEVLPTDEKYKEARVTIAKLTSLKDEFRDVRGKAAEQTQSLGTIRAQAAAEVMEAIPDYEAKEPKLTEWAMSELNFTMPEIQYLSDPTKVGQAMAVKFIKAVSKVYDKLNAGKKAEEKKKAPEPLNRAGEREELESEKPISPDKMSYTAYREMRRGKQK